MTREDRQALLRIAHWICEQKYFRVKRIRQLAETEENYLILIREVDRVKSQVQHARSLEAEATLTLVDWLLTLERFQWRCAYCQERSFEILSHVVPLPRGGTTPGNCVPSCYSCSTGKSKMRARQRVQALQGERGRQTSQGNVYSTGSNASSLNR